MKKHRNTLKTSALIAVALALFTMLSSSCKKDDEDKGEGQFDGTITLQELVTGLTSPVSLKESPDQTGRIFIVDQVGVVRLLKNGNLAGSPFLDVRNRMVAIESGYDERGLLDIAFHPDFRNNGLFYIYYSAPLRPGAPDDFDHTSVIAEYSVSGTDPDQADMNSERIVMQVDQPQGNHNGGTLIFGPDGYLYISLGDGGNRDDEGTGHVEDWYDENAGGNGQDITENLHGSILRIDVAQVPYGIPGDNPFVGKEGMDEIYAYGFRNPYRMSFDMGGNRALYVSDAGQELWEEVSVVTAGNNYGWNVREGAHCFDAENPNVVPDNCPQTDYLGNPLIDPVLEFRNSKNGGIGLVVVGGYVYRGTLVDNFQGYYVFGSWSDDFGSPGGKVLYADSGQGGSMWEHKEMSLSRGSFGEYLLAFGQDLQGEVYVLTTSNAGPSGNTGKVYRIAN